MSGKPCQVFLKRDMGIVIKYYLTVFKMPGFISVRSDGIIFLSGSVGTTVTWTNNDGMTHTVTSDASGFDNGDITMGSKYSRAFSVAGTFTYHCTIHPAMKGTIVVK
jgi:hypothetical protein